MSQGMLSSVSGDRGEFWDLLSHGIELIPWVYFRINVEDYNIGSDHEFL